MSLHKRKLFKALADHSSKQGIRLYYNSNMETYKIFIKPKIKRVGNLNYRHLDMPTFLYKKTYSSTEHKSLFDKYVGTIIPFNKTDAWSYHLINSNDKLFEIICGTLSDVTFTYCYKSDGRLYLCKIEGEKDDEKCKHAWLCNKVDGIVCAGSMKISKLEKKI